VDRPAPMSIAAIKCCGADLIRAQGAVAVLISVAAPTKTTCINIIIDEGLQERANREMQASGRSRAALREKV
jgi:hypothetical protein